MSIISIIVPLKEWDSDKLKLLFASIANISNFNQIELLVIYSSNTPEKHLEILKNSSISISLIYAEPRGIYNAYNLGVSKANGKWIIFLGGDDFLFPSLKYILNNLDSYDAYDAIVCPVVFGTKGILKPLKFKQGLVFRNWCHQGIIYKKSLFNIFRYDEKYRIQADHKFNIEICKDHKIMFSDLVISYFNTEGLSQTNTDWLFYKDMPQIVKKSFGNFWSFISSARRTLGKVKRILIK